MLSLDTSWLDHKAWVDEDPPGPDAAEQEPLTVEADPTEDRMPGIYDLPFFGFRLSTASSACPPSFVPQRIPSALGKRSCTSTAKILGFYAPAHQLAKKITSALQNYMRFCCWNCARLVVYHSFCPSLYMCPLSRTTIGNPAAPILSNRWKLELPRSWSYDRRLLKSSRLMDPIA